jgi:hypothetical protein
MNYLILTSGVLATSATIGHFTLGKKNYIKPVMASGIDEIPKKVMECLFHYMSVFLIFTTVILLSISMGYNLIFNNGSDVVKFIAFFYAGLAVVQFIIGLTSSIKGGVFKLFQWVFWALIAVFALIGVY